MFTKVIRYYIYSIIIASSTSFSLTKDELFKLDEVEKKQLELDQRERVLKKNSAKLDELTQFASLLHKEQIELVASGGLSERVTLLQNQIQSSLDQWRKIIELFETIHADTVTTALDNFSTLILQAYENQDLIEGNAKNLCSITSGKYELFAKISDFPAAIYPEYAETISVLNKLKAATLNGLLQIKSQCGQETLSQYRATINSFRNILEAKLYNLALNFPALRDEINSATDLLKVINEFQPQIAQLNSIVLSFEKLLDKDAIFTALELFHSIENNYKEINANLAKNPAKETSKKQSKQLLDFTFERAKKSLEKSTSSRAKMDIFLSFSTKQFKRLAKTCQQDMQTAKVDCEALRTLTRFNTKRSVLMQRLESKEITENDLKFVEAKLIEIDRGWSN